MHRIAAAPAIDPQELLNPDLYARLEPAEADWLLPALRTALGSFLFGEK